MKIVKFFTFLAIVVLLLNFHTYKCDKDDDDDDKKLPSTQPTTNPTQPVSPAPVVPVQPFVPECKADRDCKLFYICDKQMCVHKNLFQNLFMPFTSTDLVGLIAVFIASLFSTISGIGGGVFFVPILYIILNFDMKYAVAFSLALQALTEFVKFLWILPVQRETKNRPIINYSLAAMWIPPILCGALFGITLNFMLPDSFIKICFILMLVYHFFIAISYGLTLRQFIQPDYRKSKTEKKDLEKNLLENEEQVELEQFDKKEEDQEQSQSNKSSEKSKDKEKQKKFILDTNALKKLDEEEEYPIHWSRTYSIILQLAFIVIIIFLRGSDLVDSIIKIVPWGPLDWILFLLRVPFCFCIYYYLSQQINAENELKVAAGRTLDIDEFNWDNEKLTRTGQIGFVTGFLSGYLSLGGVTLCKYLVELQVPGDVLSATVTYISFWGTFIAAVVYALCKVFYWDYLVTLLIFAFFGLYIAMKRFNANDVQENAKTVIQFLLSFIIFVFGISMCFVGFNTKTI